MKTAFVFAGGGAAGAYQLGCIKAIYKKTNIRPDVIYSNSAGSLNAAGLSYAGLEELEAVWRSIRRRQDVFGDRFFGLLTPLFGADSLWVSKPLRLKLEDIMTDKRPVVPISVNYVDLKDGALHVANSSDFKNEIFIKMVLASASIPVVTEPVDGSFVDGAVRQNTPLKRAIDEGADRIYVFLNSSRNEIYRVPVKDSFNGVREIAMRALSIMSDEMYHNDINTCLKHNEEGVGRQIELHWLAPSKETIDTLDFKADLIAGAIDQGYNESVTTIEGGLL